MTDKPPCPMCVVASTSPPAPHPTIAAGPAASAYVVLSTPSVLSFIDVAPLARGHIILCPREHVVKISDVAAEDAAVLGFWLPVLSRAVVRSIYSGKASWDIISANGPDAGQTAPHVHFHIIPRIPAPTPSTAAETLHEPTKDPSVLLDVQRRTLAVAQGLRRKLDDEDAMGVCDKIKDGVKREIDYLKRKGDIVEGKAEWELWGNVEGRRGLKL